MLATGSQTQVKEENDGSDYDELHDDDAGDEFHIPDVLPVPVPYSPPIERLHKDIHRGLIDLDPPYQRGAPLFASITCADVTLLQMWSGRKPSR